MTKEVTSKSVSVLQKFATMLMASALVGVIAVSNVFSYGATIFSGDLSEHLAAGVGLVLFGGFVVTTILALTSSIKGAIATPKAAAIPILAVIAAEIAAEMPASATSDAVFLTITVAFAISTLAVGLVFLLFGIFRMGSLIRFMPYPIFGGFLAGLGWLLIRGGLGIMIDLPLKMDSLSQWIEISNLVYWLPGVVFAFILLVLQRRFKHGEGIIVAFLGGLAIFYLAGWITGTSQIEMAQKGWLLGPFPTSKPQLPFLLTAFQNPNKLQNAIQSVNWEVISHQASTIFTLIPIALLSLIFANSGLELAAKEDANLNRELKSAGIANILASLGGGVIGCQNASLSTLPYRMGVHSRLTGLFTAAFFGIGFFYGNEVLSILPKAMIGGLIIYLGLSFLVRWVIESYAMLPKTEYLILVMIHVVIATIGLLQGVLVGALAAIVLFVINYSQTNVIRKSLSRKNYQSNVERYPYYQEYLQKNGEKIYILKLQGFIFFGTAYSLFQQVQERARDEELPSLEFLVLDFQLVHGVDSSALDSFTRMRHFAASHKFEIVFSDISLGIEKQLKKGKILKPQDDIAHQFEDIDHAVEWCEEKLLYGSNVTSVNLPSIKAYLSDKFPASIKIDRLLNYLEKQLIEKDAFLIRKGDLPLGIYFIERGQVTVQLTLKNGGVVRLRTMGSGTIIGELGVYLNEPATATVIADMPSITYFLSQESLEKMKLEDPELAMAFHKFMAAFIGQRLVSTHTTLQALMD
ncbi:MAG: hypothetical protein B6I38_03400 [Anaerolineaceae bacterium 4572_5.1]|nr:MAG: hypothetical protein B6I38_03400 [Anaerolineaceae bacterium 4572_5.1]RLD07089.1 MAG: hypothetical protein DRI56_07180 [Chloroflexota bacterium]